MTQEIELTEKQQEYYNERVEFFKSLHAAVPTGLIYDTAIKMTELECEEWLIHVTTK